MHVVMKHTVTYLLCLSTSTIACCKIYDNNCSDQAVGYQKFQKLHRQLCVLLVSVSIAASWVPVVEQHH
jgi:hypothetical protein